MKTRLALLLTLSACAPAPAPTVAVPAEGRLPAECALLAEAARRMPSPHAGLSEGCPGIAARDARHLREQMASLRAATSAPLPPGVAPSSRGETVFRRLITRGVPPEIAAPLTTTDDFRRAAS